MEGLAQQIVNRDIPASILGHIFSLDMGVLMADAKYNFCDGEYEDHITEGVLHEVERFMEEGNQDILFIDKHHLIMAGRVRGAEGGGMDAGNLFKQRQAPIHWYHYTCSRQSTSSVVSGRNMKYIMVSGS